MSNNQPPEVHPQPIFQIKITTRSDGNVNVSSFPTNLQDALTILTAATHAVMLHFVEQAKAGNLNKHNNIIPPITVCTGMHVVSPVTPIKHIHEIVTPAKSSLVGAGGKVL